MPRSILFEPFSLRHLRLKNRIVMPPMGMGFAHEDGTVSDRMIRYYRQRAEAGVGMIVVENCIVDPDVLGVGPELGLWSDKQVPGLERLRNALRPSGSVVGLQLNHMGRQTTLGHPVAPSPIPISSRGPLPKALSESEIANVVEEFVSAARRAAAAGFDFVEIHGAHGYLICEFLSPISNRREDRYGGDPERRLEFPRRIVRGIRDALGAEFPVQFRFSASEYVEGGLDLEQSAQIAQRLVEFGVDSLSVSAGNWQTLQYIMAPMFMPEGYLAADAARIKQAVNVPVIAVGRIHRPEVAERILQGGQADLVAVGRGLIADGEWAHKLAEGRADDIRPCISCNTCVDYVSRALEGRCTVNAAMGREYDLEYTPAARPHRVLIVGGGPAGLEAARVARLRGHEVSLVEKGTRLGGKLHVSAAAPSKGEVHRFTEYLVHQVDKLGVHVELGCRLDREGLLRRKPEIVILATGSSPVIPPLAGVSLPNVVVAEDVLLDRVRVGERVVIIGGGGTGCETAEFLAERGHKVTMIEMMAHIGMNIEAITRRWMYYQFRRAGVRLFTQSKLMRIEPGRVFYQDQRGGESGIDCDHAVIALGYRSSDDMAFCEDEGFPVPSYRIGDCEKPGTILDAVVTGATLAARI